MNGTEWQQLDDRLRKIETTGAVTAERVETMVTSFTELDDLVDEIRLALAERKGAEEQIRKESRLSGGITGGVVSAAFFGLTQGFAAIFKSS